MIKLITEKSRKMMAGIENILGNEEIIDAVSGYGETAGDV